MKRTFTFFMTALLACVGAMAQTSWHVSKGLLDTQVAENNNQYTWTSEKMTAPDGGFSKLRVTFLKTSNNEKLAGFPCVALAEFYLYGKDGSPVTLAADNFSSNATQDGEGSIAALCDNVTTGDNSAYDWYWHSQWSGTPNPYGYHYLEIDVTNVDAASLSEFSIGWATRRAQASPAEVVISVGQTTEEAAMNANSQMLPVVSTEFVHVYTIKSVRSKGYLTYSEESESPVGNNNVTENGYWYFTAGEDGKVCVHNLASGKVLGTDYKMAEEGEWYISPAVYRPGLVFSKAAEIASGQNCIDDQSGSIGGWNHVAGDNEGTTWLVELADVDAPMLSLQNKKIAEIGEPATTVESGQWYVLNNVGRGNYVSQEQNNWKMRATDNLAINQSAEEKAGYLFKITKNGEYYNIVSGNGKFFKLGSNTASTSAAPVNFEIALIGESADNFYLFDKDNGYAADGQDSGYGFVGWSESIPTSAGGNDSYRLLPVVLVERDATDDLRTLIAEIEAMGIEGSDNVGYYSVASVNALNAAIATAKAVENATEDDIAALQTALDGLEIVLPEDGKYYRIMAVSEWNDDACYLGSKNSEAKAGRAEFVAEADKNTIFLFKDGYLKNCASGHYLVSSADNFLGYNGEQEIGSVIAFQAASNGLVGALNISFNAGARWLYCHQDNYTDAGSSCGDGKGYCFTIEEVAEADNPETSIESVETETETVIYDLSGRRVEKMEKGIYIVNGKKVVVK